MGFDVVEIAVEDPSLIDIKAVKKALEKYNLKASICGAFGPTRDFTHEDPAIHANCFILYTNHALISARNWKQVSLAVLCILQ